MILQSPFCGLNTSNHTAFWQQLAFKTTFASSLVIGYRSPSTRMVILLKNVSTFLVHLPWPSCLDMQRMFLTLFFLDRVLVHCNLGIMCGTLPPPTSPLTTQIHHCSIVDLFILCILLQSPLWTVFSQDSFLYIALSVPDLSVVA